MDIIDPRQGEPGQILNAEVDIDTDAVYNFEFVHIWKSSGFLYGENEAV